jgi:hypothetical protein
MTTHDDMCTCDRCMREDHDRTLQRVGDLERENAELRRALLEARRAITVPCTARGPRSRSSTPPSVAAGRPVVIWVVVGVVVFWLAGVLVGVSLCLAARRGDEAMEQAPRPVRQPGVWD